MACSYLCPCSLLICSLLAFLVSGSQIQRTLLPVISFDEGYTQLFGDANLAIHRDGKTVHLSLDERTGSYPFMVSILGFRVMFFLLLLCVGFHWEFLCAFFICRVWICFSRLVLTWILQCFYQVACRLHCWSCGCFLCE